MTFKHKETIESDAKDNMGAAINLLLARKVSLFTTNHHIGQGKLTPVIFKVLTTLHSGLSVPSDAIKSALHMCRHWFDTSIAFTILGIRGSVVLADYDEDHRPELITADSSLTTRVLAGPAGSAKLFMARGILLRLIN